MSHAFATSVDTEDPELWKQSKYLIQSIHRWYSSPEIYVCTDKVPQTKRREDFLEENTTEVIVTPLPIEDYPISLQLKAFEQAANHSSAEKLVMIDTDIVLLSKLSLPDCTLAARPTTLASSFWQTPKSNPIWNEIGVPTDGKYKTVLGNGTMQCSQYNSGVVVTDDKSIPSSLMEKTRALRSNPLKQKIIEADESERPLFFSDQVALASVARQHHSKPLALRTNYPIRALPKTPSNIEGLHYGDTELLQGILNATIRKKLNQFDTNIHPTFTGFRRRAISVSWFTASEIMPHTAVSKIRELQ